ncbi:MAG: prolyl oligopeptidase family serine peptidase [Ginsengibacter sp.]
MRVMISSLFVLICITSFAQYNYPATKTVDSSDTYFGTTIKDPYRWLENLNDSSVKNWFKAQADYTNEVMSKVPGQQILINEMVQIDKVLDVQYGQMALTEKGFIVMKRLPGDQAYKYYYRITPEAKDVLIFDPSKYENGKVMDVNHFDVSIDGKYAVFNMSEQGMEIGIMRIMEIQTGKWLADAIGNTQDASFVAGTNNEIIYAKRKTSDPHVSENSAKRMLHIIGTPESSDKEIMSAEKYPELHLDNSLWPVVETFYNCPFVFAEAHINNSNEIFYAPVNELKNDRINWKSFCEYADKINTIQAHGKDIYCLTSKGNNHYRLVMVTLPDGNIASAQEIFAGDKDWKIGFFAIAKDYMVINLNKNDLLQKSVVYNYATDKTKEIHSSIKGNLDIFPYGPFTDECSVVTSGWTTPRNFYQYDLTTGKFSNGPFHTEINYPGIDDLSVEEVEVPSYDGTLVPLSIIYNKKYLKKDGSNVCMLEGYGSYGSSYSESFAKLKLPLLNRGVVFAAAHVRGGGEKGEDWHFAGFKTTKPNTWKDFNACADWLIKNKYTTSQKLGCKSASAGGILVGRAITERPNLYKVAIIIAGMLNPIRAETTPNGPGNISEFGTMKDSVEGKALIEMDALYHVKPNTQYPAQLITTGFNDPRVDSWIPGEFVAAMQAANNSSTPTLLSVNYKGGHFGGSTINEHYAQTALQYAFLLWQCGDKEFQ